MSCKRKWYSEIWCAQEVNDSTQICLYLPNPLLGQPDEPNGGNKLYLN